MTKQLFENKQVTFMKYSSRHKTAIFNEHNIILLYSIIVYKWSGVYS